MKFSFKSFAIGFACAALSLGAVTYANAAGNGTLKACANKTTGVMRYISKGSCKKTETSLSWNQIGPTGLPGAAGTNGTDGAAGTKGDTGAAGTKGDTGAAGTKGDAGAKGDAGTPGTNGANTNSQVKNICGVDGTTACAVGQRGPGGGIVFMTPSTLGNTTGLFYEAAPSNWSSPSGDPTSAWCSSTATLLGVASTLTGTGAMDGAAKTTLMLGVCTSGAANLADSYSVTVNGVVYGDWFVPSKGELNQLYINSVVVGGFISGYYWSSSEYGQFSPWTQYFSDGSQSGSIGKQIASYLRPVRAF
jgi:hypothetical protein